MVVVPCSISSGKKNRFIHELEVGDLVHTVQKTHNFQPMGGKKSDHKNVPPQNLLELSVVFLC